MPLQKITKKTKLHLEILTCQECPFFTSRRAYTADSFEVCFDWTCKKENKNIASYVDWNEGDEISVPKWCPLRPANIRKKKA